MEYPGIDGFLGARAPFMVDVVVVAMLVVLPLLGLSVFLARRRRRFVVHKRMQVTLAGLLVVALAAFETDMQVNGWEERAEPSPFYPGGVHASLWIHLLFAVSTPILWGLVIVQALRKFPNPPRPSSHSDRHIFWARLAVLDLVMTAITGWAFYWLAFAA